MSSQMFLKRRFAHERGEEEEEEEEKCLVRESKRQRSFLNAVREVMKLQSMQGLLLELEPFLRRVVREEVQKGLSRYVYSASRPSLSQIQASVTARWRLYFKNKLPDTLFTGSRIEAEESTPVKIIIVDSNSKMIITSGPLSSIRIEILALDGDFCGDDQEDWTEKEFSDSLVREREGKRPLLTGDLVVTLKDGIGNFGDINFTDNSSWIRSRKFRLGARVLPSYCTEERIQEAISGAFFVKDHRGELYKKHHPPSLHDDVWRLEKIGKDGVFHKRLADYGIKTVQDFLKFLVMDHDWLRSILGSGMSNKIWEATVEHAWECLLDNKLYSYYIVGHQVMLVFNSIFQIVGAKFGGYDYQSLSNLTTSQMASVNRLKQLAYKNRNDIIEIDVLPVDILSRRLSIADASAPGSSLSNLQNPEFPITTHQNERTTTQVGFEHPFDPPLHAELSEDLCQLNDVSTGQGLPPVQQHFASVSTNNFDIRDFLGAFSGDYGTGPSTSGRGGMLSETLLGYDSDARMAKYFRHADTWDLGSRSFQTPHSEMHSNYLSPTPGFGVHISPSKWVKLMAALKCGMSIRRRVAARRRARIPPPLGGYQTYANFPS